jgi:hypothetical protein
MICRWIEFDPVTNEITRLNLGTKHRNLARKLARDHGWHFFDFPADAGCMILVAHFNWLFQLPYGQLYFDGARIFSRDELETYCPTELAVRLFFRRCVGLSRRLGQRRLWESEYQLFRSLTLELCQHARKLVFHRPKPGHFRKFLLPPCCQETQF